MTDLEKLKASAEAATPGPWFVSGSRVRMVGGDWHSINRYDEAKKRDQNIACAGFDPRTGEGLSDAKFIALANPAAILALLSRLASAEKALEPFSEFAGVVFERNFNKPDVVCRMSDVHGYRYELFAKDFFAARAHFQQEQTDHE